MRKLITAAALLTASFTATAGDRGAYVLHTEVEGITARVATVYLELYGEPGPTGKPTARGNRIHCQLLAKAMNTPVVKAAGGHYWCEPE